MAKILVISPTPSHPQDAGNRARIFSLLSGLKAAGHQVHFAFVKMEIGDETAMAKAWDEFFSIPYQRPANSWVKQTHDKWAQIIGSTKVLPFCVDDWFSAEITTQIRQIREQVKPDVVLVEYVYLSKVFECFDTNTLKVLDTHDVFGDRHKMYIEHNMPPVFFYTSPAEERRGLQRADLVMAIQKEEAEHFAQQTSTKVLTVGHLVNSTKNMPLGNSSNPKILFVGSRNHINVAAINWFIEEVFPMLRRLLPTIELDVVGGCTKLLQNNAEINMIGQVDELLPYYSKTTVVINPLRFGTGLKIKTLEALAMSRPLVTTSIGAAGLNGWQERAFLLADTPQEFADAINRLVTSSELRQALCRGASEFIEKYNQSAIEPLLRTIKEWEVTSAGRKLINEQ